MTSRIAKPEHLHFPAPGGRVLYGADQDWFPGYWKRKAGCGPCTGANLVYYHARQGRLHLPMAVESRRDFISLMERSWDYITPTLMGLNSPTLMEQGLNAFLAALDSQAKSQVLEVPARREDRPSLNMVEAFVRGGLAQDSPVAFLNLHNGGIPQLETWHWVTVVGLLGSVEEAVLEVYDNGQHLHIPLAHWLGHTARGGGFVYAGEPAPVQQGVAAS